MTKTLQTAIFLAAFAGLPNKLLAATPFENCVFKQLPTLDDGVSPANIIAQALVTVCSPPYTGPYANDPDFQKTVNDDLVRGITPDVLKWRASLRATKMSPP